MTNADKIRQMSDEELADFMDEDCGIFKDHICDENLIMALGCDDRECKQCWLDWLRKEANE